MPTELVGQAVHALLSSDVVRVALLVEILRNIPFLRIVIVGAHVGHERQTLCDHIVCEVGVLLAHLRCVVGEGSHKLKGVLAGGFAKVLVLNDRNAEVHKAVEQRLEHLGSHFGEVDEGDESLGKKFCVSGVLDRWEDVEDFGNEAEVLGLGLLCDGAEEGSKCFDCGDAY